MSSDRRAKLSAADVLVIREWVPVGWPQNAVAAAFSVGPPLVNKIIHRKLWRHL